jgi:serine/threonine-protein kinase
MTSARFRLGQYEPLLELASGGMATVYVARHAGAAGFERLVVLKRVHPHLLSDKEFTTMFRDEARLASQLRHPNVVSVIDVVETEGELFLVMDYIESTSLSSLLRKVAQGEARLPPRVVSRILVDALGALHAAHEALDMRGEPLHVVHRDVSPQNIIVGIDGASRLIDFGIAKATNRITETKSGSLKGKIGYMAPEAARGLPVDRRVDVWATGVVLFESLTSTRLFTGENDLDTLRRVTEGVVPDATSIVPTLPRTIDRVVQRALAKNPADRYATALEMLADLERALPPAPPREVGDALVKWCGASLDLRREELKLRLQGTVDSVKMPMRDPLGLHATPPPLPRVSAPNEVAQDSTRVEGTERRIATTADTDELTFGNRKKRSALIAVGAGGLVVTLLVGSLVLFRGTTPAVAPASSAQPPATATAAPSASGVSLVLHAPGVIESVRIKGARRVDLDGTTARVTVAPWQGDLPVEVAIAGGVLARATATELGPRELDTTLVAPTVSAAPSASAAPKKVPGGNGGKPGKGELQENPY